jgi:hypothetical protein
MPTSFVISASLKPDAKAPVRTCSGILRSVVQLRPVEALMASSIGLGSSPKARAISSASNPASVPAAPR